MYLTGVLQCVERKPQEPDGGADAARVASGQSCRDRSPPQRNVTRDQTADRWPLEYTQGLPRGQVTII